MEVVTWIRKEDSLTEDKEIEGKNFHILGCVLAVWREEKDKEETSRTPEVAIPATFFKEDRTLIFLMQEGHCYQQCYNNPNDRFPTLEHDRSFT
jgi:hypothetical protein